MPGRLDVRLLAWPSGGARPARRHAGLRSFPGNLPECGLLQLRVGQQPLERGVLPLQVLEPFGVVGVHPAEVVALPLVRLLRDLQLTADVSDVLALVQHPISGRQLAHDLLRRVLLPRGHVDVEPSCPQRGPQDSQTTWIN